jgi:hypothetical protein
MCMDARVPQAQDARERPPMTRSTRCWTGLTVAGSRQLLPASLKAPTLGALPPPSMESSVDASVCITADDRRSLERLLRYCTRPLFAQERLAWAGETTTARSTACPGPCRTGVPSCI